MVYAGGNTCLAMVTRSEPQERDCLYELMCMLTPEQNNTKLLNIFEGVYSIDLSASIPMVQDIRVPESEASFDISAILQERSTPANIDQYLEALYGEVYEKMQVEVGNAAELLKLKNQARRTLLKVR